MHTGRFVFSELIGHLPHQEFEKCVARYDDHPQPRKLSYWDQYLAMAFAQLTYRESLRDIEACLRSRDRETLSPGVSRHGGAQHSGRRQRNTRLAHLRWRRPERSEEHTSELQSLTNIV